LAQHERHSSRHRHAGYRLLKGGILMPLLPDTAPGEKLLLRLWHTITRDGIGNLLSPWQLKREGRAHAEVRAREMTILAQAEQDVADIRAGRKAIDDRGRIVPIQPHQHLSENTDDLLRKAHDDMLVDQLERQVNLSTIAHKAEEEAIEVEDSEVKEEGVDKDWVKKWRSFAQDISDAQMQQLWARLLSGNLKEPGSYSLHAIELLSRMSAADARNISKIAPYVIDGLIPAQNVEFVDVLQVQELGIITLNLFKKYKLAPDKELGLRCHDKVLLVDGAKSKVEVKIQIHLLTDGGEQILSLGRFKADVRSLEIYSQHFLEKGLRVRMADVIKVIGGEIHFHNARELKNHPT
jgi:hypothetical protein